MSDDRRHSVRRTAELPLAWSEIGPDTGAAEVCAALGVPLAHVRASRVAELEDAFSAAVAAVADPNVAAALRALEQRQTLVEETLGAEVPQPPATRVELSADGIGFESTEPLAAGTLLGIHLILPPHHHVIGRARVSYCAGSQAPWRVGAVFEGLDDATARRLTRFAIAR